MGGQQFHIKRGLAEKNGSKNKFGKICFSSQNLRCYHCHVIGCSDLVDLWVTKIKKSIILCASSSQVDKTRSADHAARTCKRFVYSILTTRFYYYQTWLTHLFEKFTRCARIYGFLFLDCVSRVLIGWAGKLRPHGEQWPCTSELNH